jgi:hypothetical protein
LAYNVELKETVFPQGWSGEQSRYRGLSGASLGQQLRQDLAPPASGPCTPTTSSTGSPAAAW